MILPFKGTSEELKKLFLERDQITILHFFAVWSSSCQKIAVALENITRKHKDVDAISIDVDISQEIIKDPLFNVTSIPQILFFRKGKLEHNLSGLHTEVDIKNVVKKLSEE